MDQEDTNAQAVSTPPAQPTTEVASAATALNQLADVSAKQVEEEKKTEEDAIHDQIEGDAQFARQVARDLLGTRSPDGIVDLANSINEEAENQETPVDQRLRTLRTKPHRNKRMQGDDPTNKDAGEVLPPPNKRPKNDSSSCLRRRQC